MGLLQPSVTIADIPLRPSWNGSAAAALAGLTIQWGREGLYDQSAPGRLRMEIIDADGSLVARPDLYQQRVTVTRPTSSGVTKTIFSGRIDEIAVWRHTVSDPMTGRPTDVWMARISATDLLAQLAKTVTPGFGQPGDGSAIAIQLNEALTQAYGPLFWAMQNSLTRRNEVRARAAERGMDLNLGPVDYSVNPTGFYCAVHRAGVTLFDLIAEVYNSVPFGFMSYDPDANIIRQGNLTSPTALALIYTGGILKIIFPSGVDGFAIDADHVIVDEGAEITSQVGHNITSFRFTYGYVGPGQKQYKTAATTSSSPEGTFWYELPQEDQDVEIPISGTIGGPNQLQVAFPAQYRDFPSGAGLLRPQQWADYGAPIVRELNGKLYMPPVRFHLGRFPYPAALIETLLTPVAPQVPFTFLGALYASLPGFGPMFQLVGAVLAYNGDNWTIDAAFAPARAGATSPVSYATWVTNTAAEYQDFDDAISYADFANVGTGAA